MSPPQRTAASVFLSTQPWFDRLTADQKTPLLDAMVWRKAGKGQTLVHRDGPVDAWYGVLSGMVKLQTPGPDGKVSAFLGVPAGLWFGESTVLRETTWRYDVVALRDTTLVGMPVAQFQHLYRHHLPFNHYLIERLSLRLVQAMTVIESGRLRTPDERVAQYLHHLFWDGMPRIKLSQEDLGQLTGLSRQTVNRVLKQFEARGWVSLQFGHVGILDAAALETLLRPVDKPAPTPEQNANPA